MKKSSLFTLLVLLLVVILAASVLTTIGKDGDGGILSPDSSGDGTGDGNQSGNDTGNNNSGNGSGGGTNTTCTHGGSTTTNAENYGSWSYHVVKTTCLLCNEVIKNETVEHTSWHGGLCDACGYKCEHPTSQGAVHTYTKIDETYHTYSVSCPYCGYSSSVREQHIILNGQQLCTCDLGTATACTHASSVTEYSKSANNHIAVTSCTSCATVLSSATNVHSWSNGMCSVCNYSCTHTPVTSYPSANAEKHTNRVTCSTCNYVIQDYDVSHSWDTDGECVLCGYDCSHDDSTYSVTSIDHFTHHVNYHCNTCGSDFNFYDDPHSFTNGVCGSCGYETCGCDDMMDEGVTATPTWNESGCGSIYTCAHGNIISDALAPHTFGGNGVCTNCGYNPAAAG